MGRHEEIKRLCARILDYYYANSDTEYLLNSNERIDVVGYFNNKREPTIGIEVELSSDYQHDAAKLARTYSFQLRIIVSERLDTLSLGPITKASDKEIYVVSPPDRDMSFEEKIREFTKQGNRPWFNKANQRIDHIDITSEDPLPGFEEEIRYQGLDVDIAKDILFRATLGGIHMGLYQQGKVETEYHPVADMPKELMYLRAREFVWESREGRNYEAGRQSIYHIAKDNDPLASRIIAQRIDERMEELNQIMQQYGETEVFISLLGYMGNFVDSADLSGRYGLDSYSSVHTPYNSIFSYQLPRYLIEEFNIVKEFLFLSDVVASSPPFKSYLNQIYKALTDGRLGNETHAFSSKGDFRGELYSVPLETLLRRFNVDQITSSSKMDDFRTYAQWVIIRASASSGVRKIYESYNAIGADEHHAEKIISDLAQQGIISKPMKGGIDTLVIYDKKRFNEYCEKKIETILQDILGGYE